MDSRDAISGMFDIPKDEIVYESFGCTYHSSIKATGKLYCCDKHLCFSASVAGVSVKHATSVDDISEVVIGDEFIEVMCLKEGKQKVLF